MDGQQRRVFSDTAGWTDSGVRPCCRQQAAGVFVGRAFKQGCCGALLEDLTAIKNHDLIGHLRHYRQVVGHVDCRRATFTDHPFEGAQHIDLGGHIKCRRRFIEYHQQWIADQRHGRHHTLQLPAGNLMGVTLANVIGVWQGQVAEQLDRLGLKHSPAAQTMNQRALHHLVDESFRRIERRGGALGDVRHTVAAQALQLAFAQRQHVVFADLHHPARQPTTASGITE
ncbi:hypothetical protein D3C73_1192600 [compost metagenome]